MRNKVVVSLDSHKVGPSASQITVIVYFNKTVYGDRALQVTGQLNADFWKEELVRGVVESEHTEKSRKGREEVIQQVTADSKGLRWHFAWAIHKQEWCMGSYSLRYSCWALSCNCKKREFLLTDKNKAEHSRTNCFKGNNWTQI